MKYTTLSKILAYDPCGQETTDTGYGKLLKYLNKKRADDEPISMLAILKSNGIKDAIWALRTLEDSEKEIKLFTCDCANHTLKFYENKYEGDKRPRNAIETARKYIHNQTDIQSLREAERNAVVASNAAVAAATYAAAVAAATAAYAATVASAATAASAAAVATSATAVATYTAAIDRQKERDYQIRIFKKYFCKK